jgi:hypothetical protein
MQTYEVTAEGVVENRRISFLGINTIRIILKMNKDMHMQECFKLAMQSVSIEAYIEFKNM